MQVREARPLVGRQDAGGTTRREPVSWSPRTLDLPLGVRYLIWHQQRVVVTVFPDGLSCVGFRSDTDANRAAAGEQGYPRAAAGVWAALVHHQLLHSLVSAQLWGQWSATLYAEAGGRPVSRVQRAYEDCIVLAVQRYWTTGDLTGPLTGVSVRDLQALRLALTDWLPALGVG